MQFHIDSKRLRTVIKTSRFLICSATLLLRFSIPYRTLIHWPKNQFPKSLNLNNTRLRYSCKKHKGGRQDVVVPFVIVAPWCSPLSHIKHVGMQSLLSMSSINRAFYLVTIAKEYIFWRLLLLALATHMKYCGAILKRARASLSPRDAL